jgi:hypothetical protein
MNSRRKSGERMCCKEHDEEKHGEKQNRFIVTGHVCANCDTDFGINEFGMNVEDGIQTTACPVCGCNILYVYHWVEHSEKTFPSPFMTAEVLDAIQREKENRMFNHVVPSDGGHGVEAGCLLADEECCGGEDDDCCDGKEQCCTGCDTHARFPTLDEQVERERKERSEEFNKIRGRMKVARTSRGCCMSDPSMEE